MTTVRLKLAILLTYAIFAILLNSVGTVILQSIAHFHIGKNAASTLEAFKDVSIAVFSFLVAARLPRFGYRRGMMLGLAVVAIACVAMPLIDRFWMTRLLFLSIGVGFALVKVSVYSFVGLLSDSPRAHASLLSTIEGVFMLAVLSGYWIFSAFIDPAAPGNGAWLGVYWWLAAASVLTAALLASVRFDERTAIAADICPPSEVEGAGDPPARSFAGDFAAMLRLIVLPLTLVFIIATFLYVLIEQGIGTWLPTFNSELLGLSAPMAVQATSIFAAGLALGRLGAGALVRRTGWFVLLNGCLAAMAVLIVAVLPLAEAAQGMPITRWSDAPLAAFLLPLIGFFMAPIYPTLNSAVLSAMPRAQQSAMVGLIVVFSALGGTTGSLIVGRTFAAFGGTHAFYLMLLPIAAIALAIFALRRLQQPSR